MDMSVASELQYIDTLAEKVRFWPAGRSVSGSAGRVDAIYFDGLKTPEDRVSVVLTSRGWLIAQVGAPHVRAILASSQLKKVRDVMKAVPELFDELDQAIEAANSTLEQIELVGKPVTKISELKNVVLAAQDSHFLTVVNPLTGNLISTSARLSSQGLLIRLPVEIRNGLVNRAATMVGDVFRQR